MEGNPVTFLCTVYNHDCTQGTSAESGPSLLAATPVGGVVVRARSPRSAAAKGYVRCVGRGRARILKEVLHASQGVYRGETDWQAIAPGLMRVDERLGDCYCLDNLSEAWFITVEPAPLPLPSGRRPCSRRHFLRSCRNPSRH
jgi:hypothetical protein